MKDILEFGQYVGRIVEAHNQGNTEWERQLANEAEDFFDLYAIPDYDSETGRTVEETPFDEVLCSESRKDLDGATKGEAYLQRLMQDTRELKAQAEAYLQQTKGKKAHEAPGRAYMERCADAAEGTLEYLEQLAGRETEQPAQPDSARQQQGRESLFNRKVNVQANEFAGIISQLLENGVLRRKGYLNEKGEKIYDSDVKLQSMFKSFLIGAGKYDIARYGRAERMAVNDPNRFAFFVSTLYDYVHKKDKSATKGKLWDFVESWFEVDGKPCKNLKVNNSRGKSMYKDDLTIREIALELSQMITP